MGIQDPLTVTVHGPNNYLRTQLGLLIGYSDRRISELNLAPGEKTKKGLESEQDDRHL